MLISGKNTIVTVGGQSFEIPSEKVGELFSLLAGWQAISLQEARNQSPPLQYQGKTLIHG